MKIVLAGYKNPAFPTIAEFCELALADEGHETTFFFDRHHRLPAILRTRIPFAQDLDLRLINADLLSLVEKCRPDLMLALGGTRITPLAIDRLGRRGVKTVLWTVDAPVDFSAERKSASHFDYVFCGGSEAEGILRKDGVPNAEWLPFACDERAYHPVSISSEEAKKVGHDVLFIGSYYPNRWEILRQLGKFNVGIFGPGWSKADLSGMCNISIHEKNLRFDQQLSLYASAKIIVIIHFQNGETPCYQASPKVYEALACKCFVLVDKQKDVFSLFRSGEHLVGFDSAEDLKAKIRRYLDLPEERARIAGNGYRETLARHTYRRRIEEMIRKVEKKR